MKINNTFEIKMSAKIENVAFARHIVGEFVLASNPTLDELEDIKTSVSEAVTNAVIHGYNSDINGIINLKCSLFDKYVEIIVEDNGVGIENISKALEPFFTTRQDDERSGMGFTLMQSFMSEMSVESKLNEGVKVKMIKYFSEEEDNARAQ